VLRAGIDKRLASAVCVAQVWWADSETHKQEYPMPRRRFQWTAPFAVPVLLSLALLATACSDPEASKPAVKDTAVQEDSTATDAVAETDAADVAVGSDVAEQPDTAGQSDATADNGINVLPPKKPDGALSVLSYNVMCSFCVFKDNPEFESPWAVRVPWLRDVLTRADADLVGIQELQAVLKDDTGKSEMAQLFPPESGYDYAYYKLQPGDDYLDDYPDPAVAWKKDRFTKLQEGWYWLSPTPDVSFSTGFAKTQFPRLVFWVKLKDKLKNRDLYLASTHFDNNYPSQEKSAPLSHERIGVLTKDAPVIFTGDFNAGPKSIAYGLLVGPNAHGAQWLDAEVVAKNRSIVHNQAQAPTWDGLEQIDHVFLAGDVTFAVDWWGIDLWRYGKMVQPPSDHNGAYITYVDWP
jgi:endonuclease/exonuclease/phosphatase family metal-dependent hydrolase